MNFRLQAKKLFLTYPKCDLTTHEVLKSLMDKSSIHVNKYFIVQELHEDESNHIHAFLELHKKCNIKNAKALDIIHNEITYHGNYQTCRYKDKTLAYLSKQANNDNYITNMKLNQYFKEMTIEEQTIELSQSVGMQKALEYYNDNAPILNQLKHISTIKRCLSIKDSIKNNRLITLGNVHNPKFEH